MKTFRDANGDRWQVDLISHGQTSAYLNPRVHRPVVQFSCLDATSARRYVGFAGDEETLDACTEKELRELLARAAVH